MKNLQETRNRPSGWARGLSVCVVSLLLCLGWRLALAAEMDVAEAKAISKRLAAPDRQRAKDLFKVAFELMKDKESKAAAVQFEKGLAIDPGDGYANYYLAQLLEANGDTEGAASRYRLAAGLLEGKKEAAVAEVKLADIDAHKQKEKAAVAASGGFVDARPGVIRNVNTGLEWTQSDNGSDVNWSQAQSACNSLGSGWRLPTSEELQGLFDSSGALTTRCGQWTCKVSPAFRLSSDWFWSGEPKGSSWAWAVTLNNGIRHFFSVGYSNGYRALCVRRP